MTLAAANGDNWMTGSDEPCPGCSSQDNRRVAVELTCPRFMQGGRPMACMGCGNAVLFECRTPDEDGDLLEDGCGWWFQHPLHLQASSRDLMGQEPSWDFRRCKI